MSQAALIDDIIAVGGLKPTWVLGPDSRGVASGLRVLGVDAAAMSLPEMSTVGDHSSRPATIALLGDADVWSDDEIDQFLESVWLARAKTLFLRVAANETRTRLWWERVLIERGFRHHPRAFRVSPYVTIDADPSAIRLTMERCPEDTLEQFPLAWLARERDLHMDMTREAGVRSEAHIVRYFEAARYIRPGDRVVDAACGMGYGARVLAENSLAAHVLGIDGSSSAIDYANSAFASPKRVRFRVGELPDVLEAMPRSSVDFVASFETLEHLHDPVRFLKACARVLTPGGRIVVSVPNDWSDETGEDPNPWHFHVYDWDRLFEELGQDFLVEAAFAQSASQKKSGGGWIEAGREWTKVDPLTATLASEWCLAVGMLDPIASADAPFEETNFPIVDGGAPTVLTDTAGQYANPWLLRSMVSTGLRITDRAELTRLAERVGAAGLNAADEAASLAVLAYALPEDAKDDEVETLFRRMQPHIRAADSPEATPVQVRWGVSLSFVRGQIKALRGRAEDAEIDYARAANLPFERFSPLLATKTVESAFRLGVMALGRGDPERASAWWRRGMRAARSALSQSWEKAFGHSEILPNYAMSELAEIADAATRCSVAIDMLSRVGDSAFGAEMLLRNRGSMLRAAWDREASSGQNVRLASAGVAQASAQAEAIRTTAVQLAAVSGDIELWRPFWQDRSLSDPRTTQGMVRWQENGGVQVHPDGPGLEPSRAVFGDLPLMSRPAEVRSKLHYVTNGHNEPAAFRLVVSAKGVLVAVAESTLTPGQTEMLSLSIPPGYEAVDLALETEMTADAVHNYSAWTHFEELVLTR